MRMNNTRVVERWCGGKYVLFAAQISTHSLFVRPVPNSPISLTVSCKSGGSHRFHKRIACRVLLRAQHAGDRHENLGLLLQPLDHRHGLPSAGGSGDDV